MIVTCPIEATIREQEKLSFDQRFGDLAKGLLTSWEIGRTLAKRQPEIAEAALRGELPVLAWKGGVEKSIKIGQKIGALYYLAQWQGLRNESLCIDTDVEVDLVCSRTGVKVTFTNNFDKLAV